MTGYATKKNRAGLRRGVKVIANTARTPVARSNVDFAREEIILPNGPYEGRKLRPSMQPATFIWLEELDKDVWRRHVFVAPVQFGKTLSALVIPLMRVLFELEETAILAAPKLEIVHDKWREDFLPVIKRSRYGPLLPKTGSGSRGGTPQTSITFGNGVTLKFMSGQGSDDSRSAFTSRWVFITEADKMDTAGEVSREADPVSQVEDRTKAFDRIGGGMVFIECTASIPEGRIWTEYATSTQGRLAIECPHCGDWVSPEREHFLGWQDAESEAEAGANSRFTCPVCTADWTEEERIATNERAILVHEGQHVEGGEVVGDLPDVRTIGFRASAVNNAFFADATIGVEEWRAEQLPDETEARWSAEKTLCQKTWAVPWESPDLGEIQVTPDMVTRKARPLTQGVVPQDAAEFTVGIDLRKTEGHYVAFAWKTDHTVHCVDYGTFDVDGAELGPEVAFYQALARFSEDVIDAGWQAEDGGAVVPGAVWIDAGYKASGVYKFVREYGVRYLPILGRGQSQHTVTRRTPYSNPRARNKVVREIGEDYHIEWSQKYGLHVVYINSDQWKTYLHDRIVTKEGEAGCMTLFSDKGNRNTHRQLANHWTAERMTWEIVEGKGQMPVWETLSTANHYFDAAYIACAAGHFVGWRLQEVAESVPHATDGQDYSMQTPDGQAFVALER